MIIIISVLLLLQFNNASLVAMIFKLLEVLKTVNNGFQLLKPETHHYDHI
eukprot:CAMPEP_0170123290 /NCGR_PEP_ID=MMETSP0020_2-20130122/17376_1 /TAXON_ID=98059 /ORGANISM="Dinobryon sp., Strain UTEXLB2267" /LENGTH=49 /DNA_ID=CAMNT_0010354769 /DNA_START=33 /DNA_END=182 /DNA_ORIENTATION=-